MNLLQQIYIEKLDTTHVYLHKGESIDIWYAYDISAFFVCQLFPYTECYAIELYDNNKQEYIQIACCKLKIQHMSNKVIIKYLSTKDLNHQLFYEWTNNLTVKK